MILKYLPQYFKQFGSLLSRPKRFMGHKNTTAEEAFSESLLFLAISIVLVVVMTAPLLPTNKNIWTNLCGIAVVALLGVSLFAVALKISWRLVGGKASVRSFFVTYAYYMGVIIVIFPLVILLSQGVFKVFDPELYAKILEAEAKNAPMPDMAGKKLPLISFAIQVGGYLCLSVWSFIGWGAYRQLNDLSKGRSFGAFLIMDPLALLVAALVYFVATALS